MNRLSYIGLVCLAFLLIGTVILLLLANVNIGDRPLWPYLNSNIVLKGGQGYAMMKEMDELQADTSSYYVFGTSHAYRGYDPRIFKSYGINLFNAGSSGQRLNCSKELLQFYQNKIRHVILDIYPGTFCVSNGEAQLILMQGTDQEKLAFNLFSLKLNAHTLNNYLFRLFRFSNKPVYLDPEYQGAGYVTSKEIMNTSKVGVPICYFEEKQYEEFRALLDYCKDRKIDVTLVSHPLPVPVSTDTSYIKFRMRVNEIAGEYGLPFYDFTYRFQLDSTHFKDPNHLNMKGVSVFNHAFIREKFRVNEYSARD